MTAQEAIEFHRVALLRVLLSLFNAAGFEPGTEAPSHLPKRVQSIIRRVLLPAESAYRRLVAFRARHLELPAETEKKRSSARKTARRKSGGTRAAVFWLFDSRPSIPELAHLNKRGPRRGHGPWIWRFDGSDPVRPRKPEKPPRDPYDAVRQTRRMLALHSALQDVDKQAFRLLRIMAKRDKAPPGPGRNGPVRAGPAPGRRKHRTHKVDEILHECRIMEQYDRVPPY